MSFSASLYGEGSGGNDYSSTSIWSFGVIEFVVQEEGLLDILLTEYGDGWYDGSSYYFNVFQSHNDGADASSWEFFNGCIDITYDWTTGVQAGDTIKIEMYMRVESWDSNGTWNIGLSQVGDIPAPGTFALLGLAGIATRRRG